MSKKEKTVKEAPLELKISKEPKKPIAKSPARAKLNGQESYRKKYKLHEPPSKTQEQNDLALEMITWSYDTDSVDLVEFPLSKVITPSSFYNLANHNDYFAKAIEVARENIGVRLKKGWKSGSIDKDYARQMLWQYDPKYKADQLERIRVHQEAAAKKASEIPIKVEMVQFPSSPLVPEKKE